MTVSSASMLRPECIAIDTPAPGDRASDIANCYHCGLPVPAGVELRAHIRGIPQPMCCAGCQAVAQAIADAGLDDYYRQREALPDSPREALPKALNDVGLFDHPAIRKSFVHSIAEHESEAALDIEGITCAACAWLTETQLARQPGVLRAEVNYATRRARVRWDEGTTSLSQLVAALAAIGYRAHPYDPSKSEQRAVAERRNALWRLFVAGFGMMQVMMYAIPVYLAQAGTMSADIEQLMRWASLVLTLPVVCYSAAPFFRGAWRDLRMRRIGMDVPVAIGIGSAFAASVQATLTGSGAVYFDSVTMFVFFLLGGRYLEMLARHRATRGIEAMDRAIPAIALRLKTVPGLEFDRVAVADLVPGDRVLVKPGETLPADGRVIDGASSVDESLLTGESRPLAKGCGSEVIGGSVNIASPLVVEVLRVGAQTRLAAIRRLVDTAAAEKPRLLRIADRFAARFVGIVLILAAASYGLWHWIEPTQALAIFVSVLVVSCPCALSLAAPAALTVASGALARGGLLVARGHALETMTRVTRFVFDKTGTLTLGQLAVIDVATAGDVSARRLKQLAAALESGSEHPISAALRAAVPFDARPVIENLRSEPGAGIEGRIDGRNLRLGSVAFTAALHQKPLPDAVRGWQSTGDTVVALANDAGWLGFFRLGDALRPEAKSTIARLGKMGIAVSMLSGDSPEAAARIAGELGIEDARGGLSPESKHECIRQMQARGEVVAMVGDGVNDAPVLALAQLSIAMDSGTDLARTRADGVLLGGQLSRLPDALGLARRCLAIMRQNLVWAFAYNVLAIPLAMAGWVTPWMAGIGMSASSLLVMLNALRLQEKGAS